MSGNMRNFIRKLLCKLGNINGYQNGLMGEITVNIAKKKNNFRGGK